MAGEVNIVNGMGVGKVEGLYNIYTIKNKTNEDIVLTDNLFQLALEKAVEGLNRISEQEIKADALVQEYVNGNVPLEEVIIQMEKATVAISLAMTVINSAVQTTKEILQMAV
ncbi:MAG: flagellar hook-basal body complex protein FliE [Candidatus Margulisbacteria bacterium]|nr:flagellar hook-basal body complex protein FliE [Candidatus Margulisiibacteriota bacterium]